MKPLQTNERVLTWLYGAPPNELDRKREKLQYIILTSLVILIHVLSAISAAIFIYRNISIDLGQSLYALFHTMGSLQSLYQSIAIILLRYKLIAMIQNLREIYTKNEESDSFHLLNQTNAVCEWIWPLFFKYVMGGYIVSAVTFASVSVLLSNVVYGHFEPEHAYHPFKLVLPWNQSILSGYSAEIGFDITIAQAFFFANGTPLILFISMCLHHQTFYEIFRNEAKKLNNRDEHRNDAEHFRKMVSFHLSVKNWFLDSAEAYSPIILVVLISSMLFLACCVFQVDLQMKHLDFGLYMVTLAILVGTSILFSYCYCGKMATECYGNMDGCLYECNWYELDVKLQQNIVIMMINAQIPVCYHGFGVAVLNLETFTKMIRAVFSYYMMFKTLTTD